MVLFGLLVLLFFTEVHSICRQKCYYCAKMNGAIVGDVFVEDCSVFVNSTVNITCQLNDNIPDNASSLYFKRGDTRLDDDDIILVDERTAVLPYTMSMEDKRKNFCCYSKTNMLRPIGKVEFMYIEYYPQQVENFSCIWLGLAPNSLQCFWQHPVEYKYISKMEVSLEWKVGERNPYEYSCPFVIDYVRCENITNIFGVDDVFFRINVTNTLMGVTTSSVIENRFPKTLRNLYGKPYMENLSASEINQTIKLQWTAAASFTTFKIYYNSSSGEKMIESRTTSVTVSNLKAYTVYKFTVVGYYTDYFDKSSTVGLPSDPVSVTVRTWQDDHDAVEIMGSPNTISLSGFVDKREERATVPFPDVLNNPASSNIMQNGEYGANQVPAVSMAADMQIMDLKKTSEKCKTANRRKRKIKPEDVTRMQYEVLIKQNKKLVQQTKYYKLMIKKLESELSIKHML